MLIFLVTYVVPQFAKLYQDMDAQLPAITLFMLEIGTHAQTYLPILLIALALVIFLFFRWKKTDRGAEQFDRAILKLPLLGDIWLKYQVANFSRMLSTLLTGGLPLVPSLETAGASMSSRRILNGVSEATAGARRRSPWPRVWKSRKCFPTYRWK